MKKPEEVYNYWYNVIAYGSFEKRENTFEQVDFAHNLGITTFNPEENKEEFDKTIINLLAGYFVDAEEENLLSNYSWDYLTIYLKLGTEDVVHGIEGAIFDLQDSLMDWDSFNILANALPQFTECWVKVIEVINEIESIKRKLG